MYWKPVWAILEDDFELLLVNARHVKQVPGRKTDVSDAAWLCQLAEAGLLRASFVPPKPIRALRNLTRYRKTQIQERAARGQPAAQGAGGHRDQARLRRLGHPGRLGPRDARRARRGHDRPGGARRSRARPAAQEAARAAGGAARAALIACTRCGSDRSSRTSISSTSRSPSLTEAIEEQIAPFEQAVELLCTIPGVQRRTAEMIIAEIGVDMSIFPTAKDLASWAGQCPGNHESAGKRRSGEPRKGSKWLDWALEEAAPSRHPHQGHLPRRPIRPAATAPRHKKALGAVKHSILVACWHMLSTGEIYNDLGGDYFARRDPAKTTKRLVAQLERLGHTVTLQDAERRVGPTSCRPAQRSGQRYFLSVPLPR